MALNMHMHAVSELDFLHQTPYYVQVFKSMQFCTVLLSSPVKMHSSAQLSSCACCVH